MNKARRKRLDDVIEQLEKFDEMRQDIMALIEDIQNEEQECLDSLPDNLSESERAEKMGEAIDNMQSAYDELDNLDIDEIRNCIENAQD